MSPAVPTVPALPAVPSALDRLAPAPGGLTVGVELPLDNDWSPQGGHRAESDGRPSGVPDMRRHGELAVLADRLGFAALWLRDVPLWEPGFGDAGQVFDPFPYLGYLSGVTRDILLGTAAIALPLRHPLHVAKMAATVDRLSGGRLLLGIASGDRPFEYPLFGLEHARRGEAVREAVEVLRDAWESARSKDVEGSVRVLPATVQRAVPLIMAGRGRQSPEWLAAHTDGHFTYHRPGPEMRPVAQSWHDTCGPDRWRPLLTTMLVDLTDDPDTPARPIRFGARLGRNTLIDYLADLEKAQVSHVALNFRLSRRPVDDALAEIAEYVLPGFPAAGTAPGRTAGTS
ncbi:LLM class oxidoreductase [Streptomyces amakusaensis]|uniref:LLM class oxidoreductase n=1 Tax=Streptomyces amakusaensis TaxID=67271 RepID=A0ABW0AHA1_9ACTN